ncbi:DUF3785 family protein [Clostridium sp. NSJ-6]|uniref:DUF3785 family protein n=1 Tax=Clostridium hominis TaxID=2763036 RepID=A0ABR7DCK2_9CLOT|nr:DUF3785 family protein [Clostridium hominis]MBC5629124.1 DUF3785 family protein [Clostridium hominis]MDU2671816.1 DUF3785 family protein [Clostridium sp.]
MEYKFKFDGKEYILNEENLECFFNDDENPINDVDEEKIIEILNNSDKVDFSKAYFNLACEKCQTGVEEKKKFFDFLGYNFYIFTKDGKYFVSNIEPEYEGSTFDKLYRFGKVDNSYLVTINVCKHCGEYSIEIEEFEL